MDEVAYFSFNGYNLLLKCAHFNSLVSSIKKLVFFKKENSLKYFLFQVEELMMGMNMNNKFVAKNS